MRISDRYARAVRSSHLVSDPDTLTSDLDTLGAYGLADRKLKEIGHPLAVALERLFTGAGCEDEILAELTKMVRGKAKHERVKLAETQAKDLARACLLWHKDHACKPCGGHGFLVIRGSTTVGNQRCPVCKGDATIARSFYKAIRFEWRFLVRWLIERMEDEMRRAGPMAMDKLEDDMADFSGL